VPSPEQLYDQLDGPPRESQEAVPDLQADFPSLFAAAPAPLQTSRSGELARKVASSSGKNTSQFGPTTWKHQGSVNLAEDFPSLPGSAPTPASVPSGPTPARLAQKQPAKQPKPVPATKTEEFPGLPVRSKAKAVPVSKAVITRPVSAVTVAKPRQPEAAPKVRKAAAVDPFQDDYPSLEEPDIALSAFSRLTVKNSGQDFSYTSSEASSNIKTIDQAFLDSQNKVAKSSSSGKVDLAADFPGLGKPERRLDLGGGKNKKNKKKGNSATNNNNYASQVKSESRPEKASLSSICDFLGGADKKVEKKVVETKLVEKTKLTKPQPKVEELKVKPMVSKIVPEEQVYRPSKEKKMDHKDNQPTKSNKNATTKEDFPSLGGAGKRLGANFVKADDKLIKKPDIRSQWAKNNPVISKNSKENEVPDDWETIADSPRPGPPGFSKGPPGFGEQNGQKSKAKTPPGFGLKVLGENSKNSTFKYCPPLDFQDRNVKLISTIANLIGGKSLEFGMFKDISGQFRAGKITSESYFSQCRELVVSHKFNKFFPELLVLLPDIKKQQELLVLYQSEKSSNVSGLSECSTCRQVTLTGEEDSHAGTHQLDSDFPHL